MSKIFCIGLNKTGTSSLHRALLMLGFHSLHYGGPAVDEVIRRAIAEGRPMLHYLSKRFDAYSDVNILIRKFDLADQQYPRSKFIFTWRDIDSWLDSRTRHYLLMNKQRGPNGKKHIIDHEKWKEEWFMHRQKVYDYFQIRRKDILIMNICAGQGYELLCPFLDKPLPAGPFPRENQWPAHLKSDPGRSTENRQAGIA